MVSVALAVCPKPLYPNHPEHGLKHVMITSTIRYYDHVLGQGIGRPICGVCIGCRRLCRPHTGWWVADDFTIREEQW